MTRYIVAAMAIGGFALAYAQATTPADQNATILFAMFALLYFVPWFVAVCREHHNAAAILVLNLLLGWTFIGWVAALVWASTATRNESVPHRMPGTS